MSVRVNLAKIFTITLGTALWFFLASANSSAQTLTPEITGPSVSDISTEYKEPRSQPFSDINLIKTPKPTTELRESVPPLVVSPATIPSFEERDLAWKEKRNKVMGDQISPSEKYLVSEVKVLGLYQKPEGQGVFLKPTVSMSSTLFAMVGQKFWNGEIKRINKDSVEVELKTLLTNGKYKTEIQTIPFTRK